MYLCFYLDFSIIGKIAKMSIQVATHHRIVLSFKAHKEKNSFA